MFRSEDTHITLEPVQQIQMDQGAWLSLGQNPAFALVYEGRVMPTGWCRISYRGHSARGYLSPKLLIDYGEGFEGLGSIELPPSCGQRVTAVRRLPAFDAALRLKPTDSPGRFWIKDFEIRKLAVPEVLSEIAARALRELTGNPLRLGTWSAIAWRTWRGGNLNSLEILVARWLDQSETDYGMWASYHDSLTDDDRSAIRRRIVALRQRPVISILTPVFNAPLQQLRECLDSVLCQLYPDWELCIADDASPDRKVRKLLEEYRLRDARIRVAHRSERGGLWAASNSALALASGEYVFVLEQSGTLSEHACYLVAEALNANPDVRLIYSDEDAVDEKGRRCSPQFKGAWDGEMFLHRNCVGHLSVYKADLIRKVGGFRSGFTGSEDFDLGLRCVAQIDSKRIRHLPFVLYHARSASARKGAGAGSASAADGSALRAIEDHLKAIGSQATVERVSLPGVYRIRYRLPEPLPLVTVIVPTRNGAQLVRRCVESIIGKTTYAPFEILLVDNDSDDAASISYFRELERAGTVRLLRYEGRFNYSAINNFAAGYAEGEVLALLNNDTEVIGGDWLTEMVSHAVRPGIGAVGAKLLYPDGTIQHAGVVMGLHGTVGHGQQRVPGDTAGYYGLLAVAREVTAVTGACLVVRKCIYEEAGGLDDENLPVTFNDIDFCLKLRARGYRNIWTPHAVLYHHEAATRGPEDTREKAARYRAEFTHMKAKWGVQMEDDPFYSPNLSLASDDYRLAFPPRCSVPWMPEVARQRDDLLSDLNRGHTGR